MDTARARQGTRKEEGHVFRLLRKDKSKNGVY